VLILWTQGYAMCCCCWLWLQAACRKPKYVTLKKRLTQWIYEDHTYDRQLDQLKPITNPKP
jgi:hypothetical protein